MRAETPEKRTALRSGYTTGACATATALAAARLLLTGTSSDRIGIELPRGQCVEFALETCERLDGSRARADTIKDAGDDPDNTHGATVFSVVVLAAQPGVRFHAAPGVGTVTREGLGLAVGEPAINPVPRQMITSHLTGLATETGYAGGFEVHVGVEDGERIARKTMNGRLGIVGGLSILGTTGIVRPFSCSSYIASIHQSIDVAHANGITHIAASTGSTSEAYIKERLGLDDMALVEMGDFAGAVFKHLRKVPMDKLSLCGGFGKISKMAAGHTSLHSSDSAVDFELLAGIAGQLGADDKTLEAIRQSNTSLEALDRARGLPLGDRISALARETALQATHNTLAVDVYCVDRSGRCVGACLS